MPRAGLSGHGVARPIAYCKVYYGRVSRCAPGPRPGAPAPCRSLPPAPAPRIQQASGPERRQVVRFQLFERDAGSEAAQAASSRSRLANSAGTRQSPAGPTQPGTACLTACPRADTLRLCRLAASESSETSCRLCRPCRPCRPCRAAEPPPPSKLLRRVGYRYTR